MSTDSLPSTVLKHFTFIVSLNSHNDSSVYYSPHFTDEETEPWIDYFIFLSEDRTADEVGGGGGGLSPHASQRPGLFLLSAVEQAGKA